MKRAARIDANQPQIVDALKEHGATVQTLAHVGKGCPDILVGYKGRNYLIEIKNPEKPPSERKLTKDQIDWHDRWNGQVTVCMTAEHAIQLIET